MVNRGTIETIAHELGRAALATKDNVLTPARFKEWMREMGWDIPEPKTDAINALVDQIEDLRTAFDAMVNADVVNQADSYIQLLQKAYSFLGAVRDLTTLFKDLTIPADFLAQAPPQILTEIVIGYLQRDHSALYGCLRLLGIVEEELVEQQQGRLNYTHRQFKFDRLGNLISNPKSLMAELYGWGESEFRFNEFLRSVELVAHGLGLAASSSLPSSSVLERLYYDFNAGQLAPIRELRVPILEVNSFETGYSTVGLSVVPVLADSADGIVACGIMLHPYFVGQIANEIPLSRDLVLQIAGGIQAGVFIEIIADGLKITSMVDPAQPHAFSGEGSILVDTVRKGLPFILFGERNKSRIEIDRITFGLRLTATSSAPRLN